MALAFSTVHKSSPNGVNNEVFGVIDITLDDSYPDGGWPITPANLGVSTIHLLIPPATSAGGLLLQWDAANNKLLTYEQTADGLVSIVTVSADDINEDDVIRCFYTGI